MYDSWDWFCIRGGTDSVYHMEPLCCSDVAVIDATFSRIESVAHLYLWLACALILSWSLATSQGLCALPCHVPKQAASRWRFRLVYFWVLLGWQCACIVSVCSQNFSEKHAATALCQVALLYDVLQQASSLPITAWLWYYGWIQATSDDIYMYMLTPMYTMRGCGTSGMFTDEHGHV